MVQIIKNQPLNFTLPLSLQCATPSELRGIERHEVRLMTSFREDNRIEHSLFKNIGDFLEAGDVLVVNTSGTLKAALPVTLPNGQSGRIHLSTHRKDNEWLVELRSVSDNKTHRYHQAKVGDVLNLPEQGSMKIVAPYYRDVASGKKHLQLWIARFDLPVEMEAFLEKYGTPIRYAQIEEAYPAAYYQTVFANETGSAEMPSAGRAFTPDLVTSLMAKGILFAPILLHTGVASVETGEQPYPEYFRVSPTSASLINWAKSQGRRIIAVGTTAIRALETVADPNGKVREGEGWTNLFITPERGLHVVNGLLTGFHEPKASHLLMLEALAERSHLAVSYQAAIQEGYQWHEFGDLHLVL
ncbi:MAG: queuosine biosynthesis protein [Saprospiraceae bacterium]|nr:MAG: queuosine biosynthesis protein [Saprospiraceae bacterium]